jgi:hypothetical protein
MRGTEAALRGECGQPWQRGLGDDHEVDVLVHVRIRYLIYSFMFPRDPQDQTPALNRANRAAVGRRPGPTCAAFIDLPGRQRVVQSSGADSGDDRRRVR